MDPSTGTPRTIGRFQVSRCSVSVAWARSGRRPTLRRTVAIKTVRPDIDRPDFLERLYARPGPAPVFSIPHRHGVPKPARSTASSTSRWSISRARISPRCSNGASSTSRGRSDPAAGLDALHHAHNEDVVHRDIKPSNVYRQLDGSIKLVDFGLARMMRAETLTLCGAVMGTPHYASPEQLKGEHIDKRTDIYSVGALAFEMLAGRRPFQTDYDSVATIVLKVISEPTPPMDVSISRRFPEIERIVDRAMSKSRDDRYQSAARCGTICRRSSIPRATQSRRSKSSCRRPPSRRWRRPEVCSIPAVRRKRRRS